MALEGMVPDSTIPPARFLYNNKEFEAAGGVYFYGARLYDPSIGKFSGIDRFAEKYSFQSPYAYAANNPISFIDVNGDSIWIAYKGDNYLYENGQLYLNGEEYTGRVRGFLKRSVKALGKIRESSFGAELIHDLQSSTFGVTIESGGTNRYIPNDHGEEGNNIITNNTYALQVQHMGEKLVKHLPFDSKGDGGTVKWGGGAMKLAHELAHGYDGINGKLTTEVTKISGGFEEIREIRAVYMTNRIRADLGKRLRRRYGSGHPKLIDKSKQPINHVPAYWNN